MAYSKKFTTVKTYYDTIKPDGTRIWSVAMVANAVVKDWITAAEFKEITGEEYHRK